MLFGAITFLILAFLIGISRSPLYSCLSTDADGLFMTAWATFEHHSGLSTDPYEASITSTSGTTSLPETWDITLPITTEGYTGRSCPGFTNAWQIKSPTG